MKVFFIIINIICLMVACNSSKQTIKARIADRVKHCNNSCTISLKNETDFKWDRVYAFNYPISLEVITNAINQPYPYYEEFTTPLIFIQENKIVHYENYKSNIEGFTNGQIIFDFPDSLKYQVYTNNEANFRIEKKDFLKGEYYQLYQVK